MDRDKDGLLTQDEWSAAELWFQYRAAQPGSSPAPASPLPGELPASESQRERSELAGEPPESDSGSEAAAAGTSSAGESWPDPAAAPPPSTPPADDGQYDRYAGQIPWRLPLTAVPSHK